MSNYPDGMTSSDWAHVNGPDEYDDIVYRFHDCDEDKHDKPWSGCTDAHVWAWGGYNTHRVFEWTCPQCGVVVEDDDLP